MKICEIIDRPRSGQRDARRDDEREYRAGFSPYLRVETERDIPEPIFIAAMIGITNLKAVPLPASTWTLPEDQREEIVKAAIHQH